MDPSRITGARQGLSRVVDVLLGCLVGLLVTFIMSKLWPMAPLPREIEGKQHGT
jgi:uncharacterized membrane protein YccC